MLKKILRNISLFTVKEIKYLLDECENCFPSAIKSNNVQKLIVKNQLAPTKVNYILVLQELLTRCNIPEVDCITHLQNLRFYDVVFHKKNSWKTVELTDLTDKNKIKVPLDQLKKNILKSYKTIRQSDALINIITHNDIHWGVITGTHMTRRNIPKYETPIYFSFDSSWSCLCLLTNSKQFSSIISVLVESFGYSNYKVCELKGGDVQTLLDMASGQKKKSSKSAPEISSPSGNSPPENIKNKRKLDELKIECQTNWKGDKVRKRKKLDCVNSLCTFQGPDVYSFIESLRKSGVIKQPDPVWVTQLKTTKSNLISLRE